MEQEGLELVAIEEIIRGDAVQKYLTKAQIRIMMILKSSRGARHSPFLLEEQILNLLPVMSSYDNSV